MSNAKQNIVAVEVLPNAAPVELITHRAEWIIADPVPGIYPVRRASALQYEAHVRVSHVDGAELTHQVFQLDIPCEFDGSTRFSRRGYRLIPSPA